MAWFDAQRGLGRGEVAESRIDAPLFAGIVCVAAAGIFLFHVLTQNQSLTIALAVSLLVFGITVVRVEAGIYILVVAMLLSPEIQAGAVGQHSERTLNLRYDDLLIIVIFVGVLVKLAFEGRAHPWLPNPINPGILAYYSVCVLSTAKARWINVPAWDFSVAFFIMVKMLQFYMVFFMVGLAVNSHREIRRQLGVFFAVALIVCLYGIYTGDVLDRVSAPFEGAGGTEPNTFGGYLILVICMALGLFCHAKEPRWRLFFGLMVVLAVIPLIMTLSRASYLSLIVALLALGFMGRRWWVVATVALVLAFSPVIMPESVRNRVNYTFQQDSGQPVTIPGRETPLQVDTSTYERIYVWQKVRYNLTVWPILGGGVSWETVLDSQYALVLIETGVLGFAAFVFLLYRILKTCRQSYRWSSDWVAKGLGLGITAGAAGMLVHGMGTITFLIVRIMEPFWFLVALAVVARQLAIQEYAARVKTYREQQRANGSREVAGPSPNGVTNYPAPRGPVTSIPQAVE